MRKLALPEEVLLQIEQPARYIGNEFNSVVTVSYTHLTLPTTPYV